MRSASRLVVVGNGMAGWRFVQEVLDRDPDRRLSITVIGDEPGGAYNRMLLSNVLAGVNEADDILLAGEQWYADHGVRLCAGVTVSRIDRSARVVHLDDGDAVGYDVLVLATGSSAVLPAIDRLRSGERERQSGGLRRGVVAFRTLADCRRLDHLAAGAREAVVLGGGVLGLEAARGLAGRGIAVTLVQRGARLMERQLDGDASGVLARAAGGLGVRVRTGSGLRSVLGADRVRGVVLEDGSVLGADLLVLCCGVRPRTGLAKKAGLAVAAGIVVDDRLRSVSDPAVYAIGECAEHRGRLYGLVAPVWEQARVAAQVIARPEEPTYYVGSPTITRLKAAGIELAGLGESTTGDGDDFGGDGDASGSSGGEVEVVRFMDRSRGVYQKLVVRDGRLAGAILLGDTRTVGTLTQLYERGALLPADRASLLIARRNSPATVAVSPTVLPGHSSICQCNGVTKSAICGAWADGARTVHDIAARTRATTGCGTCRYTVEGLLDWLAAADTDPRSSITDPRSSVTEPSEVVCEPPEPVSRPATPVTVPS